MDEDDDDDEVILVETQVQILFGDGHVAVTLLGDDEHGIFLAPMQKWHPPGTVADFAERVPGRGVTIQFSDQDAVDRMIMMLERVKKGMPLQ